MRSFLLLFSFLYTSLVSAQSASLVLYCEPSVNFTPTLNGQLQSEEPASSFRIVGLTEEFYRLQVAFANGPLVEKPFTLALEKGMETSYCLRKNQQGEFVLRFVSAVPIAQATNLSAGQKLIHYRAEKQEVVRSADPVKIDKPLEQTPPTVPAVPVAKEPTAVANQEASLQPVPQVASPLASPDLPKEKVVCPILLSDSACSVLLEQVKRMDEDESRLQKVQGALENTCLSVRQCKAILPLLSYEELKLEFAKFCWKQTIDREHFDSISDLFTFETSLEELRAFQKEHP